MGVYSKQDWKIAIALVGVMLLIISMHLSLGSESWGDDFAAYIAEGISISQGTFDEQTVRNYYLHPTNLPAEAQEGRLVYVWGYPLLLSAVHRVVGFDLRNFSSIIFYKIPSMVALSFTVGILFLFYRRMFSVRISLFLALLFAVSGGLIHSVDIMLSDVIFLFFSMLSLWLSEYFLDVLLNSTKVGVPVLLSFLLAAVLWFCYETRLSGQSVVFVVVFYNAIVLLQNRSKLSVSRCAVNLATYIFVFLLIGASEKILAPATANLSDVGTVTIADIGKNILYYGVLTCQYLGWFDGIPGCAVGFVVGVVFLVGFFQEGLKWKNVHLSALLVGTYVVLILLPYQQGLRYIYNILPIILMYVVCGVQYICTQIADERKCKAILKRAAPVLALLILFAAYTNVLADGVQNIRNHRMGDKTDVYSAEAIEIYRYIQDNTPVDTSVAFFKPRALYLNTGRLCFKPNVNGHMAENADYFLYYKHGSSAMQNAVFSDCADMLNPVYQNESFTLYEMLK